MQAYGIRDVRTRTVLVEGSRARGSAAGVGRLWSEEVSRALRFESREQAEAALASDFERFEREDLEVFELEPEPRPSVEAFERSEPKPTRAQLSALRKLEDALGWSARKLPKPSTAQAFRERASTARSSAGLGFLLAPDWQVEAIRKALAQLKRATPPSR